MFIRHGGTGRHFCIKLWLQDSGLDEKWSSHHCSHYGQVIFQPWNISKFNQWTTAFKLPVSYSLHLRPGIASLLLPRRTSISRFDIPLDVFFEDSTCPTDRNCISPEPPDEAAFIIWDEAPCRWLKNGEGTISFRVPKAADKPFQGKTIPSQRWFQSNCASAFER